MSSSTNLQQLTDMGFAQDKAEKALKANNDNVEQAMEYLLAHVDDVIPAATSSTAEESQPTLKLQKDPEEKTDESAKGDEAGETAKSIKCEDCGRLFRTQLEVEFHATKSGHLNFSESTEEKKPLTEEEKKAQMALLEEKMKQKRSEREEKEKQEALERERLRIKSGKDLTEIRRKMEEDEMKKIVEERKREKQEEKQARDRVKAQIEADKAARRARAENAEVPSTPVPLPVQSTSKTVTETFTPQKDYKETKIQLRLPNGSTIVETFDKNETLAAVRLFAQLKMNEGGAVENLSLMTTFPRKVFDGEDYEASLEILKLVPSATIMVTKKRITTEL